MLLVLALFPPAAFPPTLLVGSRACLSFGVRVDSLLIRTVAAMVVNLLGGWEELA